MTPNNNYTTHPFSRKRQLVSQFVAEGKRKHTVYGVVPMDVTIGRKFIKEHENKTGEKLSFTGWICRCVGQAMTDHPKMNSYRKGRNKIITFDEVDVTLIVEKLVDGKKYPTTFILRGANKKTYREIHDDIRAAQKSSDGVKSDSTGSSKKKKFDITKLPYFARNFILWLMRKNPVMKKNNTGTIGLTAVGMLGVGAGYTIPITPHTLSIGIGGISKQPVVVNDDPLELEARDIANVTVCFDHDLIDGGPAVRFLDSLSRYLRTGFGLDEI